MTTSQILVICVIIFPLLAAMKKWLRMDFAGLIIATALGFLQFIGFNIFGPSDSPQLAILSFAGFGRSTIIVLVCLFILTGALERSGFARWLTKQILQIGGTSTNRLILLFSACAGLLSLFMNNVAAGALLIPSVLETYHRTKTKPSKLLIPVAFGSLLGGMATYFTTANIMISDLLESLSPGSDTVGFFSFFPTGGLIALFGLFFLYLLGDKLLPGRESEATRKDQNSTGSEVEGFYELSERTWRVSVRRNSQLIGQTVEEIGFGKNFGLTLVAVIQSRNTLVFPETDFKIGSGSNLLIIGREERIEQLSSLGVRIKPMERDETLSRLGFTVFELLVVPRSNAVGKDLKTLDFRQRFGLSVIALQRGTRVYRTDVGMLQLAVGDSLLVAGESSRLDSLRTNSEFIILEPSRSDQPLILKDTLIIVALLLGSVFASTLGMPIFLALMMAVLILLSFRIVSMRDLYEMVSWQVIFFVGCMYSASTAILNTGLANLAADLLMPIAQNLGALGLAGITFLISTIFAQIMGGQVAALITGPIAFSAAISNGFNLEPIAVATALGCSNAFLTPMAHAVNLIMMSPGGYEFDDYFRVGKWLFVISTIGLFVGMKLFFAL